jgi:hypothetical protein
MDQVSAVRDGAGHAFSHPNALATGIGVKQQFAQLADQISSEKITL